MKKIKSFGLFIFSIFVFTQCGQVTIEVNSLPSNTPKGEPIYLSGNFNYWDPGDGRYTLQLKPDSSGYFITIPKGFGRLEYKFTRGDWKTVEVDVCGLNIDNRKLNVLHDDTVFAEIGSWRDLNPVDCEYVTLVIDQLPKNTPKDNPITIAADFNQWGLEDINYEFSTDDLGRQVLKLIKPKGVSEIEFKLMRGDLSKVETDEFGNELPPRKLNLNTNDSCFIQVENWADLASPNKQQVTLILKNLPENTPSNASFYLASNANKWYPRSEEFKFTPMSNGTYQLKINNHQLIEYKVTRGSWETVEVDAYGNEIPNRILQTKTSSNQTIEINVEKWKDLSVRKNGIVHFFVTVPENTNQEKVFMPNSQNNWDENDRKYRLQYLGKNKYYIPIQNEHKPIEFKFVREGSWDNVEVSKQGLEIDNRTFVYKNEDTVYYTVENWRDRAFQKSPYLTLVINRLPENTPPNPNIYLAAEFTGNYWSANDSNYKLKKGKNNTYYINVIKSGRGFDFKFTRGSWDNVETDEYGNEIENRYFEFSLADTAYFTIKGWKDR